MSSLKSWKTWGIMSAAVATTATAWNLVVIPFLNSNYSPVAGAKRVESIEVVQKQTVDGLKSASETIEDVVGQLNRTACSDWNRRFRTAGDALEKDSNNVTAEELRRTALEQIFSVPGCVVEPQ